ncbi:MAG: hypothetical protein KC621_18235 [Myxococcales bacterium]|nr:hypothetical protein [Myxococcales bacterium]
MRRLALLSLLVLTACPPPCKQVCRKVLFDCDLDSERVALAECTESCTRQEGIYRQWKNQDLLDLHLDHRRCVMQSTCDEIADGACYEGYEELFPFDPDKELTVMPTSTPE